MKRYLVFEFPKSGKKQAIKIGFSWAAFIFGGFWLLYNQIWLLGVAALLLSFSLIFILDVPLTVPGAWYQEIFLAICLTLIAYYIGYRGNHWKTQKLFQNGALFLQEVQANTSAEAIEQVSDTLIVRSANT